MKHSVSLVFPIDVPHSWRDEQPSENMEDIIKASAGSITRVGNKYHVLIQVPGIAWTRSYESEEEAQQALSDCGLIYHEGNKAYEFYTDDKKNYRTKISNGEHRDKITARHSAIQKSNAGEQPK